jgi:hypothetical protein
MIVVGGLRQRDDHYSRCGAGKALGVGDGVGDREPRPRAYRAGRQLHRQVRRQTRRREPGGLSALAAPTLMRAMRSTMAPRSHWSRHANDQFLDRSRDPRSAQALTGF